MALFCPKYLFHRVQDIPPEFLLRLGLRGILLDADNTLSPHDAPEPEPAAVEWLQKVAQSGIKVMIVSNNSAARVSPFAAKLGLPFEPKAAKPLPKGFNRAGRRMCLERRSLAVIGDQIFTDMIGANLAGITGILVEPIEPEKMLRFRFKRWLERPILAYFRRKQCQSKRRTCDFSGKD